MNRSVHRFQRYFQRSSLVKFWLVGLLCALICLLMGIALLGKLPSAEAASPPAKTAAPAKPAAAKPLPPLPYEEVELPAADGLTLSGRLYDPGQKGEDEEDTSDTEGPVTRYPLVILLHGLNGRGTDWGPRFPRELVKAGYAVFALDLRGHGQSTKARGGKIKSWRVFQNADWAMMPKDVDWVIRFFRNNEDYPQVNARHAALVGAKLGANVAILAAGNERNDLDKDKFKALVTISPALNYKGLETSRPIVRYKAPIFMVASQTDQVSFNDTQLLYRWALDAKSIRLYKSVGDSTDLLKGQSKLQDEIVAWLKKHYPPVAVKSSR